MNRADRRIARRIARGNLPTAFNAWHDSDREICDTIKVKSYDYTKNSTIVIFEVNDE